MPALKLLEQHADRIDKLVLFYPAIYPTATYDKHYVTEVPAVLRPPFAYRQNDTIGLLEKFTGKLLVIKGQYDGLDPSEFGKPPGTAAGQVEIDGHTSYSPIPKEVIDMVMNAVPNDRRALLEVAGCDHAMSQWMRNHPREADKLVEQVVDFLRS